MRELFDAEIFFATLVDPDDTDCFSAKNENRMSGSVWQLHDFDGDDVVDGGIDGQLAGAGDEVEGDFVGCD